MVIVRLNGGLGNQLFQYAAGLALARANGDTLKLDLSVFSATQTSRQTWRNPDILDFSISAPIATHDEVRRLKNPWGPFSEIVRLVRQKGFKRYYDDWHPEVMRWRGDMYLDGYFQCERYFTNCFSELQKEFVLSSEKNAGITSMSNRIAALRNPVSLHVRRGDYVRHPEHEICTSDYFRSALSSMREAVGPYNLVVFSDDVQWVRAHLELGAEALFVSEQRRADGSGFSPSQELVLMSQCSHHIISNSTFSWWGAYLDRRPDKVVMAPALWNRSRIYPHKNILPEGWRRLPVAS